MKTTEISRTNTRADLLTVAVAAALTSFLNDLHFISSAWGNATRSCGRGLVTRFHIGQKVIQFGRYEIMSHALGYITQFGMGLCR